MRATEFEFRHRFWFIFLLFWAAFSAYWIDHRGAGVALVRLFVSGDGLPAIHGIFGFAALLAGIAALVRTWASAYLQSERVHDANLRTEGVVADGPYRHLRNPLYFGNLLLAVGMGLLASRLGFVILGWSGLFSGGIAAQIITRYSNLTDVVWNGQSKVILNNRIVP